MATRIAARVLRTLAVPLRQGRPTYLTNAHPHPHPSSTSVNPLPIALLATSLALTTTNSSSHAEAAPPTPHLHPLSHTEPNTGVSFPSSLHPNQHLSGIGARLMGGLVKVYAVGIYVDPTLAKSALADWHGFSATDIASAKPLWDAFCSPKAPFTRTVRLIVVRDVAGTHFQNGFERAVLPRVKQASAGGNCRPAEVKRLAKKFCAFFAGVGKMKIGSEIRITVDGELVTLYVDGRTLGDVRCAQLAWAVLDMYVGDESVVPGLKDNVAIGLHEVLAS